MTHYMKLNKAPFSAIESGQKTIELRLYDEKRQLIKTGDIIIFTQTDDFTKQLKTKALRLHIFNSFEELYNTLPLFKCGYTQSDIISASPKDMEEYYSISEQEKYGVVGIEIEIIK